MFYQILIHKPCNLIPHTLRTLPSDYNAFQKREDESTVQNQIAELDMTKLQSFLDVTHFAQSSVSATDQNG